MLVSFAGFFGVCFCVVFFFFVGFFCVCGFCFVFFLLFPCVLCLYTLSSVPKFLVLFPELGLVVCACLIHFIDGERKEEGIEMSYASWPTLSLLFVGKYCTNEVIGSPRILGRDVLRQVMLYARMVQEVLIPSLPFTEGSIIRHPLIFLLPSHPRTCFVPCLK